MQPPLPPFLRRIDSLFRLMRHFSKDLAERHGLTLTQLVVLGHIFLLSRCTMSELKNELDVTTGAVTGLVDRLERMGLVTRAQSTQDRRVTYLEVTPAGRTLLDSVGGAMNNLEANWLAGWPADERASMLDMFDQMLAAGERLNVPGTDPLAES